MSKNQNFIIAINFFQHITFLPVFFGDPTRSEKPKNEIKNCDFDFGWSKYFSEPSDRESKIQKSTFQSLDSDRSLGPRPVPWWVGRWFASSFERFRGLYRFSGVYLIEYKSHTGKRKKIVEKIFSFEKIFSIWKNILDLIFLGFFRYCALIEWLLKLGTYDPPR